MSNEATTVPDSFEPLCAVIKRIESSNNMSALRFERVVFNRITNSPNYSILAQIQKHNQCSMDTARVIYSMSFGGYQIMGFNLYDRINISVSIAKFLNDYCLQDETFYQFIQMSGIVYSVDELKSDSKKRIHFAKTYNGSESYALKINKAITELKL